MAKNGERLEEKTQMNGFGDFLSQRVSRLEDPSFGDRLRRKKAAG